MDEVTQYISDRDLLQKRANEARMRLVAVELEAAAAQLARAERAADAKQRIAAIKEARATVAFAARFPIPDEAQAARLEELQARLEDLSAMYLRNPLTRTPPTLRGHKYLK